MEAGVIACIVRNRESQADQIAILDENLALKKMIHVRVDSDLDHIALSAAGAVLAMDGNAL
ncbi:MAG TPA: hypothetical protein PKN70_07940 [Smithellaceae bacterium]|jgi:hypothetical protein|nr:hypothetical protein [Smithellaceae bacterium]HQM45643.1 hypothetical protein [Smithellaceae bacterium]